VMALARPMLQTGAAVPRLPPLFRDSHGCAIRYVSAETPGLALGETPLKTMWKRAPLLSSAERSPRSRRTSSRHTGKATTCPSEKWRLDPRDVGAGSAIPIQKGLIALQGLDARPFVPAGSNSLPIPTAVRRLTRT